MVTSKSVSVGNDEGLESVPEKVDNTLSSVYGTLDDLVGFELVLLGVALSNITLVIY